MSSNNSLFNFKGSMHIFCTLFYSMCTINTDSVLNNINIKISKVTKSIGSGYCNYYNKYLA